MVDQKKHIGNYLESIDTLQLAHDMLLTEVVDLNVEIDRPKVLTFGNPTSAIILLFFCVFLSFGAAR